MTRGSLCWILLGLGLSAGCGGEHSGSTAWQTDPGALVRSLRNDVMLRPAGSLGQSLDPIYLGKTVHWNLTYLGLGEVSDDKSAVLLFNLSQYGISHERSDVAGEFRTDADFTDERSAAQSRMRSDPLSKLLPYWAGGDPAASPVRIAFQCSTAVECDEWKKVPANSLTGISGQVGYTAFYLVGPRMGGPGISVIFNASGIPSQRAADESVHKMGGIRIDHVVPRTKTR